MLLQEDESRYWHLDGRAPIMLENPIVSLWMARSVRGQAEKTECFYRTDINIKDRRRPAMRKEGDKKAPSDFRSVCRQIGQ